MRAISTQAPREGWLLRTRRYLASRIYPAIFADYAVYKARSGNLEKRHSEQAREIQSLRDERELLLDMLSAKNNRISEIERKLNKARQERGMLERANKELRLSNKALVIGKVGKNKHKNK